LAVEALPFLEAEVRAYGDAALAGDEPASAKIRPQAEARHIIDAALATTTPATGESILQAAPREADHMTQDAPAETERRMEQPQANVTSSHDAAGGSLVVDLTHDAGIDETEDGGAQHRWWQRPTEPDKGLNPAPAAVTYGRFRFGRDGTMTSRTPIRAGYRIHPRCGPDRFASTESSL
jgi:hypothetical protein